MDDFENRSLRPAVAHALAYLSDHLADRIHLRDLCRAAGVSPRTLSYLFLRTCGTTPMAYLKQQRLRRARQLLRHADPTKDTVAAIARQCGFNHMGQFALDYRKATGERPSDTLKRRRQGAAPRDMPA